jgi:hypothetical protein
VSLFIPSSVDLPDGIQTDGVEYENVSISYSATIG